MALVPARGGLWVAVTNRPASPPRRDNEEHAPQPPAGLWLHEIARNGRVEGLRPDEISGRSAIVHGLPSKSVQQEAGALPPPRMRGGGEAQSYPWLCSRRSRIGFILAHQIISHSGTGRYGPLSVR